MPRQEQRETQPFRIVGVRKSFVSIMLSPHCPQEIPGTYCTGDRLGLGAGPDGTNNLDPTGIRSPDRKDAVNLGPSFQYISTPVLRRGIAWDPKRNAPVWLIFTLHKGMSKRKSANKKSDTLKWC
jgi:hypothetical protein